MSVRNERKRRRHRSGPLLTPLIDVIFLLCIFFVLNTSFRQERYLDVSLPESQTSEDIQASGMILTLREDGSAALDGQEIPWESITSAVRELAERTGADEVIIRGDEDVSYGRTVAALDRVRLAGLENITLQTQRSGK